MQAGPHQFSARPGRFGLIRRRIEGTFRRGEIYTCGQKGTEAGLDGDTDTTGRNVPTDVRERIMEQEGAAAEGRIEVRKYGN